MVWWLYGPHVRPCSTSCICTSQTLTDPVLTMTILAPPKPVRSVNPREMLVTTSNIPLAAAYVGQSNELMHQKVGRGSAAKVTYRDFPIQLRRCYSIIDQDLSQVWSPNTCRLPSGKARCATSQFGQSCLVRTVISGSNSVWPPTHCCRKSVHRIMIPSGLSHGLPVLL
ncbi:hypothetical protein BDY21DRAFT_141724 [Lineolata rhizophorae]|uniref:Uncharacterized protein n=1 Tax=Lineolata rhizophorae TaxID=578093 RepID=A0A6A6NN57_9PEZI|nr:hypothetical protein BDY21DRAFT_141724 [Lineolata rhizophorae]